MGIQTFHVAVNKPISFLMPPKPTQSFLTKTDRNLHERGQGTDLANFREGDSAKLEHLKGGAVSESSKALQL